MVVIDTLFRDIPLGERTECLCQYQILLAPAKNVDLECRFEWRVVIARIPDPVLV